MKWAVVIALMPLVTPGPAVSTATPGRAGELGHALGREGRGLLVADVDDAHGGSPFTAAS